MPRRRAEYRKPPEQPDKLRLVNADGVLEAMLMMTPRIAADGWRSLDTAPHDGTEVQIRVVHYLAPSYDNPVEEGYIATARAHWIDHNGGGFTWHGLAGTPAQWRPLGSHGEKADSK